MGSFADYLENKLLDHAFGPPSFTITTSATAAVDATTISVSSLPVAVPNGTLLYFNGAKKFARVTADAAAGATSLTVEALPTALGNGDTATYRPGYVFPTTVYVGFSTTTITDAGGNITEPSGNNYSRISVTNNSTNFPAASAGAKSNGAAITSPTASGSWGTITDFFIADASSGGNILGYGALAASKTIGNGDTASFAIGELDITLT